jgi:hypothetical protein
MRKLLILIFLSLILVAGLLTAGYAWAYPSEDFNEANGDVFDDWEICRTRAFGGDGFYQVMGTSFRPAIAFESLGSNTAAAYRLGEQFANEYPDLNQRAEAIFGFVRDRVRYTSDIDQFEHEEFAQNADELAVVLEGGGAGYGDCEDSAVLLAIMYKGAGYRSAITVGKGHTATLVYLPDYKKATAMFTLKGETGWVWAEATGKNNPLGWVPKEFINVKLAAYEISTEEIAPQKPADTGRVVIAETGGGSSSQPFPFISIIGLLWLIPLLRRRRAR